jgi:hypothetical protein
MSIAAFPVMAWPTSDPAMSARCWVSVHIAALFFLSFRYEEAMNRGATSSPLRYSCSSSTATIVRRRRWRARFATICMITAMAICFVPSLWLTCWRSSVTSGASKRSGEGLFRKGAYMPSQ